MNSTHGHEVLNMMLESPTPFSRKSLTETILKKYGENMRFHTCSAENMTAAELVDFLEGKGKFVEEDGGFNTAADKICNH